MAADGKGVRPGGGFVRGKFNLLPSASTVLTVLGNDCSCLMKF